MPQCRSTGPEQPDCENFWCTRLDTAPQEELRDIQSEKLRVAVCYAYECIPFYRRKFDRIGLQSGDIRSVDYLALIPVTTKQEMSEDLAEHSPWGTYTAFDDDLWVKQGWQIFASSGTTAQGMPNSTSFMVARRWLHRLMGILVRLLQHRRRRGKQASDGGCPDMGGCG